MILMLVLLIFDHFSRIYEYYTNKCLIHVISAVLSRDEIMFDDTTSIIMHIAFGVIMVIIAIVAEAWDFASEQLSKNY